MKVALLRVGIDSGAGGMQGPLFKDGKFEFVPIPGWAGSKTYGNTVGRYQRKLLEYFRTEHSQSKYADRLIHDDPEFGTFTYGDPNRPKRGLHRLENGDLLVFYSGLEPWPKGGRKELFIVGYFIVEVAGHATDLTPEKLKNLFSKNAHLLDRNKSLQKRKNLVLVKGGRGSRLLRKAYLISSVGRNCLGRPLKVLSPKMRKIFGHFGGHISIERSIPRWVTPEYVECAAKFVRGLR